jgi:hypothetical protein
LGIALEISVRQNPMLWLLVHDQGDIAAAQRKPEAHALPAA